MLLCAILVQAHGVTAQNRLALNRPEAHEIVPGTTHSYGIELAAGDYASGSIRQRGRANLFIYLPGGELLRRFPGPPTDGTRTFAFVAESAGTYRLEVVAEGSLSANYELQVGQVLSISARLRAEPDEQYRSPRIEALRRQAAAGQTNTDTFWSEVERQGTPLVEPFGTTGTYQLVTFLWRERSDTRNVLVLGSFQGGGSDLEHVMRRIPRTDVWYLTLRLQAGARFTYQLSPNDPLTFEEPRQAQRAATLQADPLNPHRILCPPNGSKFVCTSAVELPGARPQPWIAIRAETPTGRVESFPVKSAIQQVERPVSVYTPPGYRTEGPPNALLVLFDRQIYQSPELPTPTILDNLIAASKIPPTVALLVANVGNRRVQDLSPDSNFAEFVANELMPWVRARYNVTHDPAQTVVGGASLGGLVAAYVGLRYSNIFGNVLSQSGSFWWAPDYNGGPESRPGEPLREQNWTAKEFIASPKLPLRLYLDAGTFEAPRGPEVVRILVHSRHLRDVLLAKGYEVQYQQFAGGHDAISWRGTLSDGLIYLLGRR
jgi:enterochelin esterase family protein